MTQRAIVVPLKDLVIKALMGAIVMTSSATCANATEDEPVIPMRGVASEPVATRGFALQPNDPKYILPVVRKTDLKRVNSSTVKLITCCGTLGHTACPPSQTRLGYHRLSMSQAVRNKGTKNKGHPKMAFAC